MSQIPTNVSESTRRLNPHLYGAPSKTKMETAIRVRQKTGPVLNKLETRVLAYLQALHPDTWFKAQAMTLLLANGVRYTPDFWCPYMKFPEQKMIWPTCIEVKGRMAWDDALVKIKVAAREWPEFRFILVWDDSGFKHQIILP